MMDTLRDAGLVLLGFSAAMVAFGLLAPARRPCVLCAALAEPRPVRKSALPLPSPSRN